ncbi:hypothetical protein Y032_0036g3255 [Ancylostoma ceylanicum]|uniref:Uncharacterized protein n=1 Tax=Ancylostoma ceylanicum TaxID=53326 RepID=A0A016ULB5_9BILA|nr:hypothetical protein Y032_0036g3255 [Ancylostoma ceylanicum]
MLRARPGSDRHGLLKISEAALDREHLCWGIYELCSLPTRVKVLTLTLAMGKFVGCQQVYPGYSLPLPPIPPSFPAVHLPKALFICEAFVQGFSTLRAMPPTWSS